MIVHGPDLREQVRLVKVARSLPGGRGAGILERSRINENDNSR